MPKHKHAEVIKAWADGAKIQYKSMVGDWYDDDKPVWLITAEYRVKPEPKPDIVRIMYAEVFGLGKFLTLHDNIYCTDIRYQKVSFTLDGETGHIKSVELLDK
jgi:hypothetical protein